MVRKIIILIGLIAYSGIFSMDNQTHWGSRMRGYISNYIQAYRHNVANKMNSQIAQRDAYNQAEKTYRTNKKKTELLESNDQNREWAIKMNNFKRQNANDAIRETDKDITWAKDMAHRYPNNTVYSVVAKNAYNQKRDLLNRVYRLKRKNRMLNQPAFQREQLRELSQQKVDQSKPLIIERKQNRRFNSMNSFN